MSNKLASRPNSSSASNSGFNPRLPRDEPEVFVITSTPSILKSFVFKLSTDEIGYPVGKVADVP